MSKDHPPHHARYMRRCVELAQRAIASGDPAVAALIVRDGDVIAEGIEGVKVGTDVTAHAEIEAVRAACRRLGTLNLTGCTLYTNVEPCVMCAYAMRLARLSTVVTGAASKDAHAALNGWNILTTADLLPGRPPPSVVRLT